MFSRILYSRIERQLQFLPAVAILGARQVGKTTLAKRFGAASGKSFQYLDLESPADLAKLRDVETYLLERSHQLVIIDEVQRMPELFPILRSVIDADRRNGRFILLGSASPHILTGASESLAGRIAYSELSPFVLDETGTEEGALQRLWLRGGFPQSYTAPDDSVSFELRQQFLTAYIERDLPLLGLNAAPITIRRLLGMLAHLHGQQLSLSALSNALDIDSRTLQRYLDFIESSYLTRRLSPWFGNIGKRLVKSPRIYFSDSGFYHALAGIESAEDLAAFPARGASWEGFVMQQILSRLKPGIAATFYRTQDGAEIDLLLEKGGKPVLGLEMKTSNAPHITRGTTLAAQQLGGVPVWVVTPSVNEDYRHNEWVRITALARLTEKLEGLVES